MVTNPLSKCTLLICIFQFVNCLLEVGAHAFPCPKIVKNNGYFEDVDFFEEVNAFLKVSLEVLVDDLESLLLFKDGYVALLHGFAGVLLLVELLYHI